MHDALAILLGLTLIAWTGYAQALTQTRSPTNCTNQNNNGGDWSNPGNAEISDDNGYATSQVNDGEHTDYLKCTGYGFSLPSDAVVEGITVSVARGASNNNVQDYAMRLVRGGVIQSTDRSTNTRYPVMSWLLGWFGDTAEDHGGSSDLWGASWTATQINASDFGAAVASEKASSSGGDRTVYVDQMEITVTYSTPTNVVINTYHPGTASIAAGTTSIPLGASTGASTAITAGDLLLIIQMQDASITYSNDSAYGDGVSGDPGSGSTAAGNSGMFEYAVAANSVPLAGGTLTLTCGTINAYSTGPATSTGGQRRFQVIRVPVYTNYTLDSVSALAWNGSTGGVLAFDVTGTLNLNSQTITVSGRGFRGGAGRGSTTGSGAYTDYRTPVTNMANGSKGEGIAGTPRYVYSTAYSDTGVDGYPSGSFARGAPGNAGGGGTDRHPSANDENSGGGGGGNGGRGGIGGIGWCPTFNTTGPYYGCGYSALASIVNPGGATGGFGGSAVSGLGATRVTLGGGGGAATTNNSTGDLGALSSSGAAGGGIIMIRAATMTGNATFNANGNTADNSVGNDGSGGGGAGGAVMISAGAGMNGVAISVRGGAGGSNLVPGEGYTSNPHGPGGGGGGGYAITSGNTASCNASGGDSGVTYRNGAYFGAYGALAGSTGACATTLTSDAIPGATLGGAVACPSSLDHFSIDIGAGSASTCAPKAIAISARDSADNVLTGYTGNVSLITSSGHGDWLAGDGVSLNPDAPAGTLANGTGNDGIANYMFAAGDQGTVTLYLEDHHADDLTISVSDLIVSSTSGILSFRDNAFVITPLTCTGVTCVAPASGSSEIVAGRNHSFNIVLKRRDPSTGDCATATGYTGTNVGLKFWLARDTDDPAGTAPSIGATALPDAAPGANNVGTLDFVAGESTFVLSTADVGKFRLVVRDDTSRFAQNDTGTARALDGDSANLTVRPFALGFTEIQKGALVNPGGTAFGGSAFVVAGDAFSATVGGYLYDNAEDVDSDGVADAGTDVTDNGLTPRFAWLTDLALGAAFTPNSGGATPGTLGASPAPPTVVQSAYSGGKGTNGTLTYDEAGSITLAATASNYLNTSGVMIAGTSATVGRFYPDHFTVSGTVTPSCSATTAFSYMDQPLLVSYTLDARNKSGAITRNYDVSKGYTHASTVIPSLVAENNNDGTDLSGRLSAALATPPVWTNGQYVYSNPAFRFSRAADPDGPYEALLIGVSASDPDGTAIAAMDMQADSAVACCTAHTIVPASTRVRYGRARLLNANGSELLDLKVPFLVQYYAGNGGFSTNGDDTCTAGPVNDISLALAPAVGPLTVGDTGACDPANDSGIAGSPVGAQCVPIAPVTSTGFSEPPTSGSFNLWLMRPGVGKTGSLTVTSTVPAWLRYDWDNTTPGDENPSARASFGIYKGNPRHIYMRELY